MSVAIDVSGQLAALPAVSRLYVDDRHATSMIAEIANATMACAKALFVPNEDHRQWQAWYWKVLKAMRLSMSEYIYVLRELDDVVRWRIVDRGQELLLKRHEAIARFGNWLPLLSGRKAPHPTTGIDAPFLANAAPRRDQPDGSIEVDIGKLLN